MTVWNGSEIKKQKKSPHKDISVHFIYKNYCHVMSQLNIIIILKIDSKIIMTSWSELNGKNS